MAMLDIKLTAIECKDDEEVHEKLKGVLASMRLEMIDYTHRAARGECAWICASCCGSDQRGMPDECFGGVQWCTDIITRDKLAAQK